MQWLKIATDKWLLLELVKIIPLMYLMSIGQKVLVETRSLRNFLKAAYDQMPKIEVLPLEQCSFRRIEGH